MILSMGADEGRGVAQRPPALGLDSYTTTVLPGVDPNCYGATPGIFVINTHGARMSRMAQSVRTAARMHCESLAGQRWHCVMQTLTVAPGYEWSPEHISEYVRKVRKWCIAGGAAFRCAWGAELQRRGAIQYHVLVWLPVCLHLPK